ncbi:hypothetical protein U1763_02620 [Sphingomonas sp. LB2R24]|uniref:hypothetical protein n=1 Tax=Sphingomonas sorbitolis TaxID=3096165 RepID=UPI002FC8340C
MSKATLATIACLAISGIALHAQVPSIPKSARASEVRLPSGTVALPFVMVREYPFIEGEVAGVNGKLMLDTGMETSLALNDHRVPLTTARTIGTGFFGSGQTYATKLTPIVTGIRIGPLPYPRATDVQTQDATLLEGITPDFIGWVGYGFWRDRAMKLDYRRGLATFYDGAPSQYLAGEKVVATIPYRLGKLPNHPLVDIRIGGVAAVAAFDTGQYGTLYADAATKRRLSGLKILTRNADGQRYDLGSWTIGGQRLTGISGLEVSDEPFAAAKPIGITSNTILTIGYGFLKQYKTVWDFRNHTIYLLAR